MAGRIPTQEEADALFHTRFTSNDKRNFTTAWAPLGLDVEWMKKEYLKYKDRIIQREIRQTRKRKAADGDEKAIEAIQKEAKRSRQKTEKRNQLKFTNPEQYEKERRKVCAYTQKYYALHRDECRARNRIYEQTEHRKQSRKEWNKNNKERILAYHRMWYHKRKAERPEAHLRKVQQTRQFCLTSPKFKVWQEKHKATFSYRITVIKISAASRGLDLTEFFDNLDYFKELMKKPCYYCGVSPMKNFHGLDRLNSALTYLICNTVPCCTLCNMSKSNDYPDTFMKKCNHIHHFQTTQERLNTELFEVANATIEQQWQIYRSRAALKGLEFDLSFEEFCDLLSEDCTYCGRETCNGLDRVENDQGYLLINSVPCCKSCNRLKRCMPVDSFFAMCELISQIWLERQ